MNKGLFMGRLTGDPDIRYSQDGSPVVRFGFAVNRIYHKEGEADADFFSCVCFGKTAERFEKLQISKGTKLLIECEVRNNNYTDKDGVKRRDTQFYVNNFEFCESKSATASNASAPVAQKSPVQPSQEGRFVPVPDDLGEDGLPF